MISLINKFTGFKKGILIVHEGISGSGKSESIRMMYEYLLDSGYKTAVIEWNSNPVIRKLMRTMDNFKILTPVVYSLLQFIAFLISYITKIAPLLNKNYIVIADRYIYTAFTRDAANGIGTSHDNLLYAFARKPDVLFFHNTHPKICFERIKNRGKKLFYMNRRILKSKALKNKDLYYLKKLYSRYLSILYDLKTKSAINVFFVNSDSSLIPQYLEQHLKRTNYREYAS